MSEEDQQFLQRLLEAFQIEAREHVEAMSAGLLELEAGPPQERTARIIETIFREAHSLKGAARAVDSRPIETVCQALESVFSAWKRRSLGPRPDQFDVIHRAVNLVATLLQPGSPPRQASIADSVEALRRLAEGPPTQPAPSSPFPPAPAPPDPEPVSAPVEEPIESRAGEESVRIATAKLDSVLLQAEELLAAKLAGAQRVKDFREVLTELARVRRDWSRTCAELRRGPELGARALESALDSHSIRLEAFETRVRTLVQVTGRFQRGVGTLVDKLLEGAKRLVMLPAGRILEGFPRLIRELARDQNKDVQLTLRGHEVEVDKRILEEMKGPLLHMLRNCVDHGIEAPTDRGAKPPRASIDLAVEQLSGSEVRINISDDGRGLDLLKIKAAAVKAGKINAEQARRLTEEETRNLIFRSDVSTSPMITEISGRGLGLAIVREKVQKLGGRIFVSSQLGMGTAFSVILPVTLATLRAVLVRAAGQPFFVPAAQVDRALGVSAHEIQPVEGRDTISIEQRVVPLVRLDEILDLPSRAPTVREVSSGDSTRVALRTPALVLGTADQRIAFRVDEIGLEQEVIVKPLGKPLVRVRNVAGATVQADGRPVPLLHVLDLLDSAARFVSGTAITAPSTPGPHQIDKPSILVVEDSITSRMLLKNVLEAAGYLVTTAVDGADALATLRTGDFQLVVSDIDMPRMDGIDLTSAIRRDPRRSNLPVILVTARETREDRERGIDAGANAYIAKSSFDQANLLNAIRRLL